MNSIREVPSKMMTSFIEACHEIGKRQLLRCSSGNMSFRINKKYMLITASRSWKGSITPSEVTLCDIEDEHVISGKKPSVEIFFHAGILRSRPDINVVLHFQSPNATVISCAKRNINYFVIPEIPFYIGKIVRIPFFYPVQKNWQILSLKQH